MQGMMLAPGRWPTRAGSSSSSVFAHSPSCTADDGSVQLPIFHTTSTPLHTSPPPLPSLPRRSIRSSSSEGAAAVCRICHGGEQSAPFSTGSVTGECLISPCHCRGTMGLYHRTCLERWLGTSNTDRCEICTFVYITERRPLSLLTYLKRGGGSAAERRNLIGDTACWCVLTPLALISAYLCAHGAVLFGLQYGWFGIEVPGLFLLSFFLVLTYGIWLYVSIRYHTATFREWQLSHQQVRIINAPDIDVTHLQPS